MSFYSRSEYKGSAYLAHGGSPKGVANEVKVVCPGLLDARKEL